MAQVGVDIGSYTFNAVAKTITFVGVGLTSIEQIKPIINGNANIDIFNPLTVGKFGTLTGQVLTLDFNTGSQNNSDKLYICVNLVDAQLSLEATQLLVKAKTDNLDTPLSNLLFDQKLLQVDSVGTTTYLGYANAGTLTSGATWAIKRIVETGSDVSITWADGNNSFDNIWDNRLVLTYS